MEELWMLVTDAGEKPDLLVGIATGGELCARLISHHFPAGMMTVALRRKGTEVKRRTPAISLLAHLPYAVTNRLRQFEDSVLERRAGQTSTAVTIARATVQLRQDVDAVAAVVRERSLRAVLVVDDAVDSGATLGRVVAELRAGLPATTRIVTAVLTQTRAAPVYCPDFRLHDGVLLRFPWSIDFRAAK